MPRRRSNLGRCTRKTEAFRRVRANQTEEQRASANERHRQRMAQRNTYSQTMVQQRILYTNKHCDIKHIINVRFSFLSFQIRPH
jgi:hypothetical protein